MAQQQQPPQPLQGYKYTHFNITSPTPFVAHVEINRPSKLNAFYEAMWLELRRIFQQLSTDPDVRAVVLSGSGERAFTAGLDVQAASAGLLAPGNSDIDGARKATALRRHILEFQECVSSIEKCEKPVICVLHGISLGLAIDLACCADVRICSQDVRLAVKEVDIGLAADIGTLSRLPKVVGNLSWVKDVCFTARDFGAEEARAVGFVSKVYETKQKALEGAMKLAELVAGKSPVAVQSTKELLSHARDNSVADSLKYTAVWNSAALQARDTQEALMSGIKKTKPRFEKL
ncbi:ClpP/crotonase-like domain-containing protein [Diplogelasinospora grovesii]|uniref:ClpP/crotonase-like domain-containing protein n=1 Tax=Diplogelasinospora grovesii TaxID=303347 RepID=A0AAN6NHP3_9PEZI|nr:ClpP/crotonase-like domain-containing protein [Diplogelasinospora grovesii]